MELVKQEVQCEKESLDLGKAIESLMVNLAIAKADGFQAGQDVPAVLLGSLSQLLAAVDGAQKIGEASKENLAVVLAGVLVPTLRGLEKLLAKK